MYDLSKGTIQARLNTLEDGDELKVEKASINALSIVGESSFSIGVMSIAANSTVVVQSSIQLSIPTKPEDYFITIRPDKTNEENSSGLLLFFDVIYKSADFVVGYIVIVNPTSATIKTTNFYNAGKVYAIAPVTSSFVTNVSGNVISGGSGNVTKSYVDSQDAALDAKITTAINAANANGVSIHGAGAAYDNTKGTIAARLEALEAGGGTSSTKIANGTGMAQVGPGKELVVDYSATGFTSAPVVVASHCQTGDSDTDTSGIVKVLSVTKTGCKISIIGGTTDHDYPVSWIATGT